MRMSVGVDLHKGQFTAHWLSEDGIGEERDDIPPAKAATERLRSNCARREKPVQRCGLL